MKKVWNCFGDSFDSSTRGRINHANGHLRNIYVFPKSGGGAAYFRQKRGEGIGKKRKVVIIESAGARKC